MSIQEAIKYFTGCISSQENYGEREFEKTALAALKIIKEMQDNPNRGYTTKLWLKKFKEFGGK